MPTTRRPPLLGLLAALAACGVEAGVDGALFACGSDDDCDAAYTCFDDGSVGHAVCRLRSELGGQEPPPAEAMTVCELVDDDCAAGNCDDTDFCREESIGRVLVPAGSFYMGCNDSLDGSCEGDESPQHLVETPSFMIDEFEVTAANYAICLNAGGCSAPDDSACAASSLDSQRPMNCVTWEQAKTYCQIHGGELCTEAQWELAARRACELIGASDCAAAMPTYPWGDASPGCELAVKDHDGPGCGTGAPLDIGSVPSGRSVYGPQDMAGNVYEWVLDCYHAGFEGAPDDGSEWGDGCGDDTKVVKGGGYASGTEAMRSSERAPVGESEVRDDLGFRCCAPVP